MFWILKIILERQSYKTLTTYNLIYIIFYSGNTTLSSIPFKQAIATP